MVRKIDTLGEASSGVLSQMLSHDLIDQQETGCIRTLRFAEEPLCICVHVAWSKKLSSCMVVGLYVAWEL